jgi:flavorubredoxin
MSNFYQPVKITDTVYWVGAIDWDIRDFHGYSVNRGTTYNAYLVVADKVALIDTVKESFTDEMMLRISKIINPARIDYIISNHSELDHSGALPVVAAQINPERILASKMGVKALRSHFPDRDIPLDEVQNGESLNLGGRTLKFIETRMLHWPDSMFSYVPEERLLFSQDAFGMHLATAERFTDQIRPTVVYREMAKYYANILMPYSHLITKLLASIKKMDLTIDIIANDHGPLFRRDISNVLEWYQTWANQLPTSRAVIIYDTMWGSTKTMANIIAEGIYAGGGEPAPMPLSGAHRSDIATELLQSGGLVTGSPTLNNTIYPTMADVMCYLKGLQRKNLVGAAFGSYGWSGEAVGQLKSMLEDMNVKVIGEQKTQYVPGPDELSACYKLGFSIGNCLSKNRR